MPTLLQRLARIYPGESRRSAPLQKEYHSAGRRPVANKEKVERKTAEKQTERTRENVEKEDFLLSQIDEFREKAKQLQNLLALKESKVSELQALVSEREGKAQELELILTERQEEADKIVNDFSGKVDDLADKVTAKLAEMERIVSSQVEDAKKASAEQLETNRTLNSEQIAVSKRMNEEQIAANRKFLEEQVAANKKLNEEQVAEVKMLLENATSQLESIKTDLSEKVHSENVKCYRNIQELFNEFDARIEKLDETEQGVEPVLCKSTVLVFYYQFYPVGGIYFIFTWSVPILEHKGKLLQNYALNVYDKKVADGI